MNRSTRRHRSVRALGLFVAGALSVGLGCAEPCHDDACHTEAMDASDAAVSTDQVGADGAEASVEQRVAEHCGCMLFACHDAFHDRWGVSDAEATAGCRAELGALEVSGSGDTLSCREAACLANDCAAALGSATCR